MAKTVMTLLGEALLAVGVTVENNMLVVPEAKNVTPAINALKGVLEGKIDTAKSESTTAVSAVLGNASDGYKDLGKVEVFIKDINTALTAMSTDTERLNAINELVTAYEGSDDLIKGLVSGKLGKNEVATNSSKLENLSLSEVTDKAVEKFNATVQGTKEEFVTALSGA